MSLIKTISFLLVFVLLATMFSGCKSKNTTTDVSSTMTEEELMAQIKNDTLKKKGEKENESSNESSKDGQNTSSEQDGKESSSTVSSGKEVNLMKVKINAVTPTINKSLLLANDKVYNWSKNYTQKSSQAYYGSGDIFWGSSVEFEWSCNEKPEYYILKVSANKSLEDAVEVKTTANEADIKNIFVGKTIYWQVSAKYKNGTALSDLFTFQTVQSPRTIRLNGVSNTRDIGGYMTESGKRVKQGMVYRTALLDGINSDGLSAALTDYKIKTDLDLRKSGEGSAGKKSPLGTTVNYINISCPYYLGKDSTGINNSENWPALKQIVELFADSKNYPIVAHCSLGRDRTGTLCFLINGLLGVSKEDLFLDYELSFFSYTGCQDNAGVDHLVTQIEKTYNFIADNYGNPGDSFSTRVEKFLLDVGVTQSKINAIKNNLLEK